MSKALFITLRVGLIAAITLTSSNSWADQWLSINKVTGKGVYEWNDGRRYEGDVVNGKRQGHGEIAYPDGSHFEGEFFNDNREKHGVKTLPDGKRFEGEFENDKAVQGILTSPDGWRIEYDHIEYVFDNGRTSKGRRFFLDGRVYEGDLDVNSQPSGKGVLTWPNGERFEGMWENGKQTYGRTQYTNGIVYEGNYDANGSRSGKGVWISQNGERIAGEWEKGVLRRRTDDEGGFQWGKLAAIGVGAAIGGAGHLSSEAQTRVVTAAVNDSMAGQQGIGNLQSTTDTLLAQQKAQQARAAQQAREQQGKAIADEAANNERLLKAARESRQSNAGQQQTVSTDRSWQQQSGTPINYATTSSARGGSSDANSNRSAGTASNADSPKLYTSIVEGRFRGIGTTEAAGCEAAEKDAAQWSPTHLSDKRRLLSKGTCSCNNGYSNAYGKALECIIPYKMEVTSPYSNIQSGPSKGVSK